MPSIGYGVYRWGDVEPTGLALELEDAKKMLRAGSIEGEVRDAEGKVVFEYKPKRPLNRRIEEARERVRCAEHALKHAQFEEQSSRVELKRLEALLASTADPAAPAQADADAGTLPLFGGVP